MVVTAWPSFSLYRMAEIEEKKEWVSVTSNSRFDHFCCNLSFHFISFHSYLQVLPAASSPSINILISLFPKILESNLPISSWTTHSLESLTLLNHSHLDHSLSWTTHSLESLPLESLSLESLSLGYGMVDQMRWWFVMNRREWRNLSRWFLPLPHYQYLVVSWTGYNHGQRFNPWMMVLKMYFDTQEPVFWWWWCREKRKDRVNQKEGGKQ